MQKSGFAVAVVLLLLAIVLIQFAATPLVAQDFLTPTLPIIYATLAPDPMLAALAADYPRVDCSTSALPLQRLIACEVLGVACIWVAQWGGESGIWPSDADMLPDGDGDQIARIRASGTHDAYMNLIAGNADLILVARAPSQDEFDAADAAGVRLDMQPVARDAFVFVVNSENPRGDFTLDEIRAVYAGQITSWGALGVETPLSDDPANPIRPYIRDRDSGSQELMNALVMRGMPMIDAPNLVMRTMIGLTSSVEWDRAGIGYSVYYYTVFIAPADDIKLAAIDGTLPTTFTIADGSYPLVTDVYAVIRADAAADSPAARLRDWLLTGTGQAVVAESGYVPVTLE
jgi:phosphate transport system substrate-binding protein